MISATPLIQDKFKSVFLEILVPIILPKTIAKTPTKKLIATTPHIDVTDKPAENPDAIESTDSGIAKTIASLADKVFELSLSAFVWSKKISTTKEISKIEKETFFLPLCFLRYALIVF